MRIIKTGEVWKIESTYAELGAVKAVKVNGAGAWWHGLPCSRPKCPACAAGLGKTWWTADANVAAAFGFAAEDESTRRGLEAIVATRRDAIDASRATSADLEIPCPDGLAYMPFQKAGIAYALKRANVLIGDEMGTGKSIQTCGILNMLPYPERRSVLVVCPASLRINWKRELEKWLVETTSIGVVEGSKWPDGSPDIIIINYDVLVRHLDTLTARRWDVLVMDECFPAGTMVQTPTGYRRIEDMRPGDRVVSAVGEDRVVAVSTRNAQRLLRVGFSDGTNVVCTQNHPFLTASGWVRAMDLSRKHCMITGHEAMRILRQPVRRQWRKKKEPFLRDILRSEMADATAWNTGEDLHTRIQRGANKATQGRSRKAPRVGDGVKYPDERAQSNGEPRYARSQPGGIASDRAQAADPGWERARPNGPGIEDYGCYPGPSMESRGENRRTEGDGLSNVLQGGLSDPGPEVSYRSGRIQPRGASQAGGGQKEGCLPHRPRVVSVEVLEQDDPGKASGGGGGYQVFNLQVERHPSYVVNGLLVHNCHACKNPKAQRTKAVLLIQAKRRVALTGTPILNRPIEFWTLAHMLAPAEFPSWKRYVDRYCAPEVVYTPRGPVTTYTGASNLEELQARARGSFLIRRLRSEVLKELPGKRRQIIPLPWNGAAPVVRRMNEEWGSREERLASLKVAALGAPNEEEYKAAVKALADAEKIAFEEISAARKALALAKVPKVIEHSIELLEDGVRKLVIFGHHKEVISRIVDGLKAYNPVVLVGDTSMDDRQAAVDAFQTDPNVRVFVGSIRAAGVGLTLTAASTMVYAELDWTPGIVSQSEDRCVRIGQKEMVLIQHLVFDDSLDSHLAKVLVEKQEVIDRALDVPVDLPELAPLADTPVPAKATGSRAVPTVSPELRDAVHEALAFLAAHCDGARTQDGMGFNRHDAAFGRQLSLVSELTDRQFFAAQKLIRKYRGQLGESLAHRAGVAQKEE